MKDNGSQYYDNDDFFHKYTLKRESKDNANDKIEKPIFQELVGNAFGLLFLKRKKGIFLSNVEIFIHTYLRGAC
ncbi:hypothetical protein CVD25_17970 [Bacillus canaveralius]|uniref:Uncharacterized protein n=1 Tax=Bacillus canaveralius TaxID=1403243 RepID=A0A2N5GSS5_9BACI|nr:hypothetical protein [Bacillus canaveralius]PLR86813.1 hypothetical protein CU635_00535 [Bacillus canaveralius]PLR92726.1 hypothetical protein CVD25_17970 [Bacillus canaveralius]RSK55656.1 hypothetical protein EJA13_03055 [Bacillus canaveralius]